MSGPLDHHYSLSYSGPGDLDCILQRIINNPTAGSDSPATPEGTANDAAPSWLFNFGPVMSYVTKDVRTRATVVINVTLPGHRYHPGYVAHRVKSSKNGVTITTVGEGAAWRQSPKLNPAAEWLNDRIWSGWADEIFDRGGDAGQCTCQ